VRGRRAGGTPDRHRRWWRHRRSVTATDDALRRLEIGEGHDLLGVRGAVEAHDRRLTENGLDPAQRADRVVADGGAGARPRVRGQPDALADGKGRRRLLLGAGRTAGLGPRGGPGDHDRGHHLGFVAVIVLVVIVVVAIDDNHLDILDDVDLDHILDDVGLDNLVRGRLCLSFVVGAAGWGAGAWCASGHV